MVEKLTELQKVAGVHILTLRADQGTNSAHILRMIFDELLETTDPHLVIDMTETGVIVSEVCSEIIRYARKIFGRGKKLRLIGAPTEARQMLDILNAEKNLLFSNELTGALLSLPTDVRQHLDIHDRREGVKRRWQGVSLGEKNRRQTERRTDLPLDLILMEA